jgi:hypothetical protein
LGRHHLQQQRIHSIIKVRDKMMSVYTDVSLK